jgi:hypothetical protein
MCRLSALQATPLSAAFVNVKRQRHGGRPHQDTGLSGGEEKAQDGRDVRKKVSRVVPSSTIRVTGRALRREIYVTRTLHTSVVWWM